MVFAHKLKNKTLTPPHVKVPIELNEIIHGTIVPLVIET
jgi:hypothetical protein